MPGDVRTELESRRLGLLEALAYLANTLSEVPFEQLADQIDELESLVRAFSRRIHPGPE